MLEKAICLVQQQKRETLQMYTAGRTDSGVHARGQVSLSDPLSLWSSMHRSEDPEMLFTRSYTCMHDQLLHICKQARSTDC